MELAHRLAMIDFQGTVKQDYILYIFSAREAR
jgi:hypothetical protein